MGSMLLLDHPWRRHCNELNYMIGRTVTVLQHFGMLLAMGTLHPLLPAATADISNRLDLHRISLGSCNLCFNDFFKTTPLTVVRVFD